VAERVQKQSRVRVLGAIRKKLPDVLSRPDLEMVALDYFRRLGHDNHRRLSKLYAWEKKKSKTSWGAQAVDYEKITAAVQAMKAADLNRFLIVCALVSDLYCPGYNPRQSLEKDSNLARAAARYKVEHSKLATAVRAELSRAKDKVKDQNQPRAEGNHRKGNSQALAITSYLFAETERLTFQSFNRDLSVFFQRFMCGAKSRNSSFDDILLPPKWRSGDYLASQRRSGTDQM